ncbi:MAG TPA: hypothetical protein VFC63_25285 [Blastocatellia bacterium]|nr:hypothetical protein [Blastocatellia bacterium]
MKEKAKSHLIAFRITDSEWEKIQEATGAAGEENPNEWSRKQILSLLSGPDYLTKNERLLFEQITSLRFILGHAFVLLATQNLTEKNFKAVLAEATRDSKKIADHFMAQRSAGR